MNEFNSYIKPFKDEVNKYSDGIHNLNKGVNSKLIEECEAKLNVKLPLMYKYFLMTWNGGELFAVPVGVELSEVYIKADGAKKLGVGYLDEGLNGHRRMSKLPKEYLIIADTCEGNVVCLDLLNNNGYEARIIKWSYEEEEIIESWNRLIDWLMDEMEVGKMIVNYDGSEKE